MEWLSAVSDQLTKVLSLAQLAKAVPAIKAALPAHSLKLMYTAQAVA
jgi:hypothetical protein